MTYLGDILVIAQLSDVDSVTHFTDDMDRFCKMAKRVCKATVTAGIGHVCNQLRSFHSLITVQRMQLLSCFIWKYKSHQYRRDGSTGERG